MTEKEYWHNWFKNFTWPMASHTEESLYVYYQFAVNAILVLQEIKHDFNCSVELRERAAAELQYLKDNFEAPLKMYKIGGK